MESGWNEGDSPITMVCVVERWLETRQRQCMGASGS